MGAVESAMLLAVIPKGGKIEGQREEKGKEGGIQVNAPIQKS